MFDIVKNLGVGFLQNAGDVSPAGSASPQAENEGETRATPSTSSVSSYVAGGVSNAWEKLSELGSSVRSSTALGKKLMEWIPQDETPPMKGVQEQLAQGEGPAST
jgi:hypothetical protein